jgi:hypothetical protein
MGEFLPGKFPATPLQFNYYIRDLTLMNDDPHSRGVNYCIRNTLENELPIGIISMRSISAQNKTLEIGFTWYGIPYSINKLDLELTLLLAF